MTQMDTRTSTDVVILKKTDSAAEDSIRDTYTHKYLKHSPGKKISSPHIFYSGLKMIIFKLKKKKLDNSNAKLILLRSKGSTAKMKLLKEV